MVANIEQWNMFIFYITTFSIVPDNEQLCRFSIKQNLLFSIKKNYRPNSKWSTQLENLTFDTTFFLLLVYLSTEKKE